jgi:hypothetical protein
MGVNEKIDKENHRYSSFHRDDDDLLNNLYSELLKYVIDKELQHTDVFICRVIFITIYK